MIPLAPFLPKLGTILQSKSVAVAANTMFAGLMTLFSSDFITKATGEGKATNDYAYWGDVSEINK